MTWGGDIRNMYPETVESCWIYCMNFIQFLGTPSRKHQFGKRKLEETPTDSSTLFFSLPAVGKSSNSKPNSEELVQFPTLASLVCYPLVNVYITMEIHHFSYVNPPFQWPHDCYWHVIDVAGVCFPAKALFEHPQGGRDDDGTTIGGSVESKTKNNRWDTLRE